MNTIWKYSSTFIEIEKFCNQHSIEIELPVSSKIVKVSFIESVGGFLTIWAIVDTGIFTKEKRRFEIYGTGHEIKNLDGLKHMETCFDGPYVWHIFERISCN